MARRCRPGVGVHREGALDGRVVQRAGESLDQDLPERAPRPVVAAVGDGCRQYEWRKAQRDDSREPTRGRVPRPRGDRECPRVAAGLLTKNGVDRLHCTLHRRTQAPSSMYVPIFRLGCAVFISKIIL